MQTSSKQAHHLQSRIIKELEAAPPTFEKTWSEFELEMLRKYYPTKNTKAIAKILGKSWGSVRNKAERLALKKEKP